MSVLLLITIFINGSDEEEDDRNALLYLPISPEIEETEEALSAEQQVMTVSDRGFS